MSLFFKRLLLIATHNINININNNNNNHNNDRFRFLQSLINFCNQSISLLLRTLSRFIMDSSSSSTLFSTTENDAVLSSPFDHSSSPPPFSDPGESIFLVPLWWWKEALSDGGGVINGVLYNAAGRLSDGYGGMDDNYEEELIWGFRDSEILVDMSREEEEEGVSGGDGDGDLALVADWMFFTALKWHYEKKDVENLLRGEECPHEIFSLQIRLLCMREARQLVIKIGQKDNEVGVFNRASSIFCTKSRSLHIWDFSGQTNQLFVSDTKISMDSGPAYEVLLKLHVYDLPSTINDKDRQKENLTVDQYTIGGPSSSSSFRMNGSVDKVDMFSRVMPGVGSGFYRTGALGLTGLCNLGNICFMNSAIQCLVHTPKLVDYFLGNFRKDLNFENPLGMNGKLAITFGDLLRKLWAPRATPVFPSMFKLTISRFAPQFSGYNQHDSQEFLSFLLDGLHEDLNRVKTKPYIEATDEDGRPDEEVADEYWGNHLSRNDSIIVDLCQGQYRSTLVCPVCKKLSITFDPFMYLSLPLPSSTFRKMTLTVISTNGTTLPHPVTVTVPINGTFKDLVDSVGIACSFRDDETLIYAEIYNSAIFRILVDPDDAIELIRDDDKLVVYRLPKDMDGSPLVVFIHEQEEKSYYPSYYYRSYPSLKKFGIPLMARMSDFSKGSELREQFLNLIKPFLLPDEEFLNDEFSRKNAHEDDDMEDMFLNETSISNNESENDSDAQCDFEFYLDTRYSTYSRGFKLKMEDPVPLSSNPLKPTAVAVYWSEKMIQNYDTSILSVLPKVCKTKSMSEWSRDSISLYKCVDAFLKEEPLGPDDMWYCPKCKEHRQASKKLDLWRLPEILVIHLKRFSFTRYLKNKLETFVDFPIDEFDLSNYVIPKNSMVPHRYMLYAVINHSGDLGGGHYTAFVKHRGNRWYEFNDGHVFPVTEERIKSHAAYVLFYRRI